MQSSIERSNFVEQNQLPLANQEYAASLAYFASTVQDVDFGERLKGVEGAATNIRDGLINLGNLAKESGIASPRDVYNSLQDVSRNNVDVKNSEQ
jgi:hypothetical protein